MPRQARNVPSFVSTVIRHPLLSAGFWLVASLAFAEDFPTFEYHEIARIGNHMGQTSLVDVDKDGKLDWIVGCSHGDVWWFQYQTPDHWILNNDGHLVVFSGEGPLGGTGPDCQRRWFIWENVDGRGLTWKEHMILEGPECHEAVAGDVDGDGDLDICSKAWNGDLHIYLRNMLVEHGGQALKPQASR